ncbi:trichohyalin-like, partial [Epinephelus moara]|uniref:trichohyalin-like n=1 Tax=Epinephelus moara TaxID=300413 RepID=UPI00214F374D
FGAFTVLLFHPVVFLALIHSCTGQSQLIGPSQPIVALVGDDIILPCHLEPAMNVFDMTVEWARPDLDPRFVVVWRDGVELESKKHPSYRGRTSVFTDELKHGNVSLKLSNVRRSDEDEATYRCFIPEIDRDRALTVQLVVGAVSSPVIQMTKTMSEVVLQCESAGWYPEPEVLWLDAEGNLLSAGPTETLRGPDDLYTVSSNVTVDKRHGNNFTCRVHQKNINQTRETHVLVPDHFFMVPSTPSTPVTPSTPSTPVTPGSQQVIIGSVIGCAALVLIAAAVFVVWKQRQKKFKNKRRSHEDGPEQTEAEKTDTCRSDKTGFQVVVEGEGERVPLMAGSEGQNNVDNRGEEKIESHSEHEDPQVGAERETHQNQLVTKPDMDRTGEGRELKSIKNEEVPSIPTEGENHQEQDMTGRQVLRDRGEGGVEQKMKPVEGQLSTVLVEAEGPKEQLQNVHTDQDVQTEEEIHQEPMTDEDKKEKRNMKEKEQVKKGGSGSIGRKKNQRDPSQPEAERTTVEDETKLQSETQKRKETEKDDIELKPQKRNVSQHLLQDRKQEMREAEHEDQKDKGQEGNQSNIQRTTERKAEKQEEKLKEEKMENERKLQSERTELKTQEGGDNQQVLDANRPEQTAEHENKKDKDQRDVTTTTESKADKQEEHINKKAEETEGKGDGREDKPPSVSGEITETPDLKVHEDTAGGQKQEKELQAEKQQQETSLRKMDETKKQPKQSTKREWIPWKER